jgi:molybdate transport system substrate-binding protein
VDAGLDLADILGGRRLAMGDPDHVPAGMYGKNALVHLGLWDAVAARISRTESVQTALALVAQGDFPLGLVFATDAAASDKVRVAGLFPEHSHPPIVYSAALVKHSPKGQLFLDFLASETAGRVFRKYGFSVR